MGAQASSFDHLRQTATEVVESSLHSALHNSNSNATSVDILRTGEIKLAKQVSHHEQIRGSVGQEQVTSPISISENNRSSLNVLGRQSSLSANNNNSSSSSSSSTATAAAGAVAFHNRSLKNDFDFDHKDDDNQFSGCGSPYSRRRVRQEEERHTDVKSPTTPLPKTSTAVTVQPKTQQMQFVRGVSTDNSDLNRNNYESNTNNETNKNCSAHKSSKSKSSKKRSSSRNSIWQRFTTTSSAALTPAAKKSTSTVALNIHHQSGTAASGQNDATQVSHKASVSRRNDADESQLLNQPLRKRSLTESVSLKRSAERRTQSRTRDRKFSSKQQTASVINQTSSTAESDNSSTVSSCRPTSSHGSLLGGKQHQQQSSNSIIGSSARRAVAEGLSKLMIPFRNSTRSTSSAENVVESSSSVEKMATKAAATKTKTTTTPGATNSTASTTSSNRPSSSSSSVKDSAPFPAASTGFAPDVPEVFVAASADEPPPTSPTNSKIPVFKLAGVPQPPHHSCSTSTLLLAKDVEQLSLSSGSGSGAGGGGGTAHTHHSQVHHGGGSHIVHVGGGTRRNSRPRESPVHQARSNIIAENMQALLQTDATTGALLQEHLSESHRGAIHTSMMSPTSNEAIGGLHGGSGGGDYDLYYAAQAQANDAACQRDKFSAALSKPAGPTGGGAVTTKKSAAPSQVGGGGNNAVLKPFMSTGAGGLAIRRKSRTDEIRAYIAAGNNEENSANEKSTANSITTGSGDGATNNNKLQQHQRHSEDLVTTTTTTSLDDDDLQPKAVAPVVDKAASAASLQSADKNFFDSSKPSVTPTDTTTTSSSSGKPLPTTTVLTKVPAPHQHRITTEQPMVAEMLNNQVWKRLTEKSMLQKSSSSDMLKCVGAFLHRKEKLYNEMLWEKGCFSLLQWWRFAHLSHLFQPNEPVLWMRGVDRSLIAQGWQDMAFLSPANIVFVYMLLRTLDGHLAGNLRQLQAHVLTALYVAYSYMGHEISYPVRLFLAADVEHKERFWLRCMRLVDDAGDNMLRINNDPLLFSALFHELIAHLRYIQPPPPPPPPPLAPLQTPSSLTALPSQPSSSDMNKSAVMPSAEIVAGSTVDTAKTDDAKSVDRNSSSAVNDVPNQTDISDAVKETNSNSQKSKMR